MSPILDLFMTLLSLGSEGYRRMLRDRKDLYHYFKQELEKVVSKHGERVLQTPNNPISLAFSLKNHCLDMENVTIFGSMLFSRCVSGTRVVSTRDVKEVCGVSFEGYGSHCNKYPLPYVSTSCAIGITSNEIDQFMKRLGTVFKELEKKQVQSASPIP